MLVTEMEASRERLAAKLAEEFPGWRFSWDGYWKAARTMPQAEALRRGLSMNIWEDSRLARSYAAFLEDLRDEKALEERGNDGKE